MSERDFLYTNEQEFLFGRALGFVVAGVVARPHGRVNPYNYAPPDSRPRSFLARRRPHSLLIESTGQRLIRLLRANSRPEHSRNRATCDVLAPSAPMPLFAACKTPPPHGILLSRVCALSGVVAQHQLRRFQDPASVCSPRNTSRRESGCLRNRHPLRVLPRLHPQMAEMRVPSATYICIFANNAVSLCMHGSFVFLKHNRHVNSCEPTVEAVGGCTAIQQCTNRCISGYNVAVYNLHELHSCSLACRRRCSVRSAKNIFACCACV